MNLDGGGSNGDAVVGLDELASRFRPLKMRIAGFGGKTTLARRIVERLGPGMVYIGEDALHFVDSGGGSEKPEKELGVDGYGDSGSLAIGLSSGTEDDDCEIGVVEAGAKKDKVVVAGDEDSDGAARKRKTKTKPKPSKKKGFQVRPSADVAAAADAATLAFLAVELMPAPCPTPPSPARLAQAAPTYYRQASQNSPLPTHHSPSRSPQPLGFVSDGFWADLHAIINPQTHVTILLDYPLSTCLYRVTKRTLKRWWSGELLFGGQLKETLWSIVAVWREYNIFRQFATLWARRAENRRVINEWREGRFDCALRVGDERVRPSDAERLLFVFRHPDELERWLNMTSTASNSATVGSSSINSIVSSGDGSSGNYGVQHVSNNDRQPSVFITATPPTNNGSNYLNNANNIIISDANLLSSVSNDNSSHVAISISPV